MYYKVHVTRVQTSVFSATASSLPYISPLGCISKVSPLDFVTYADIDGNSIVKCGLYDFVFGNGGHNGEGICEYSSSDDVIVEVLIVVPSIASCSNKTCNLRH